MITTLTATLGQTPVLQSWIAGQWLGRERAQELHSAVDGTVVAHAHAETPDFGAALDHKGLVPIGPSFVGAIDLASWMGHR